MAVFRNSLGTLDSEWMPRPAPAHQDLIEGLLCNPRRIPAKYFYDSRGSRIFSQITELSEYYLTGCELEILQRQSAALLEACGWSAEDTVNIVELGAGDGRKITPLLKAAGQKWSHLTYRPVDISRQALDDLEKRVGNQVDGVMIDPILLDMEVDLENLLLNPEARNLVLYLGSSIGNFEPLQQRHFLFRLNAALQPEDKICIGFDLKKDVQILRLAYDDPYGVTKEFNMNLLKRLNREFAGDFNLQNFKHLASYNPTTGAMESWLISQCAQTVVLPRLDCVLHLEPFEGLHVETSWKFSPMEIRVLAKASGFVPVHSFLDEKAWFVDELWTSNSAGFRH